MFLLQYPLSQHAGYYSLTSFGSNVLTSFIANRPMKADMASLLFVKRKVCFWEFKKKKKAG
jgi:hypothetical protein